MSDTSSSPTLGHRREALKLTFASAQTLRLSLCSVNRMDAADVRLFFLAADKEDPSLCMVHALVVAVTRKDTSVKFD